MTPNPPNLLLQDPMPESRLELPLPLRRRRDGHGVLASSQDDVRSPGRDGGRVERGVGRESLEDHEVVGSVQLERTSG
jgi:hypothetical protein